VRTEIKNRGASDCRIDPTGTGRKRWSNRWKKALNAFEITFDRRLSTGRN
jgi:hypothetical protein